METDAIGRLLDILPADWSDGAKLATVGALIAMCFGVPLLLLIAAFGRKRGPRETAPKSVTGKVATVKPALKPAAAAPDLDPEEWVSGNVIHYDRHKAFGYIRCDRVKGHVRFQAADFKRAPRVGEVVRFKGRYGGRRKPVAVKVETLPKMGRAV